MLVANCVVTATVSSVTAYGVYLDHQGERILVLATELSWHKEGNDTPHLVTGEIVKVMILGYNDEKQLYVGSLKRLQPEANPYVTIANTQTEILRGRVMDVHQNGISIEVGECYGTLPYDEASKALVAGQEVLVKIRTIDPDKEYLELLLSVNKNNPPASLHSG